MTQCAAGPIHALLFGLSEDLAGELLKPLESICSVRAAKSRADDAALSEAAIIFCGPDTRVIEELRATRPGAPIVVVSRHPEVSDWLDSIEAGASDYCAAPFESAQVKWIIDSSLRFAQTRQ
jgi:DNA-binding response OmpR family regulator